MLSISCHSAIYNTVIVGLQRFALVKLNISLEYCSFISDYMSAGL